MMYLSRVSIKPAVKAAKLVEVLNDNNEYNFHRLFWGLFAQDPDKKRDFLFREELANKQLDNPGKRKADPVYYVVSAEQPLADNPLFDVQIKPYQPQLDEGDKLAFKVRVNAIVTRGGKRHDIVMDSQSGWLVNALTALGLTVPKSKKERKALLLDHATDSHIEQWKTTIEQGPFEQVLEKPLSRSECLNWVLKTEIELAVLSWWQRQSQTWGFATVANQIRLDAYEHHNVSKAKQKRPIKFSSIDLSGEITVTEPAKFTNALFNGIGRAKGFGCGMMMIRKVG